MKKVISILLISNLAFSQTATLDTNTILIGEQIKLTITNHINKTKNWPNYSELTTKGIEIINTSKIDTINKLIKQVELKTERLIEIGLFKTIIL